MNIFLSLSFLIAAAVASDDAFTENDDMLLWDPVALGMKLENGVMPPDPHYDKEKKAFEGVTVRDSILKDNEIMKAILNNPEKLTTPEGLVSLCYEDLWQVTKDDGSEVFKAAVGEAPATYPVGTYFLCYSAPLSNPLELMRGKKGLNQKLFDGSFVYRNGYGVLTDPCYSTPGSQPHFYGKGNSWIDGGFTKSNGHGNVKTSAYITVPNLSTDEFRNIGRIPGVPTEFNDIWMGVAGFINNPYNIRFLAFPLRDVCKVDEESDTSPSLRGAITE
jgi:hypothetical protein